MNTKQGKIANFLHAKNIIYSITKTKIKTEEPLSK